MRLLLDECVDERLRHLFAGHECYSARYAGLAGLKNGALMLAGEARASTPSLRWTRAMPDQQNPRLRRIVLVAPVDEVSSMTF